MIFMPIHTDFVEQPSDFVNGDMVAQCVDGGMARVIHAVSEASDRGLGRSVERAVSHGILGPFVSYLFILFKYNVLRYRLVFTVAG